MSTPIMTLEQIRNTGNAALIRALGPVGMIRYLQQFEVGYGDYSTERHQWLDTLDIETAIKETRRRRDASPK
jgi:hypothetical protein